MRKIYLYVVMWCSIGVAFCVAPYLGLSGSSQAAPPPKVEICHIPPDDPTNFHTISVSESALAAHLDHGDFEGACGLHCEELCDDSNSCTNDSAACLEGQKGCILSDLRPPVNCDDGVSCTADSCDSVSGCVSDPVDSLCDDGVACTVDSCDAALGCSSSPDDNLCASGEVCNSVGCTPLDTANHAPVAGGATVLTILEDTLNAPLTGLISGSDADGDTLGVVVESITLIPGTSTAGSVRCRTALRWHPATSWRTR